MPLQLGAVESGDRATDFPEAGPGGLSLAGGGSMLGRHVQGGTLAVFAEGEIQVRPVATGRILMAGASGDATTAGSFREATLDHRLGGLEELADESVFPTHLKIVR